MTLIEKAAARFAPIVRTPEHFLVQLFSIEDKRFLLHPGIDPIAMVRAAISNTKKVGALQGASTITQQIYNIRLNARGIQRRRGLTNKALQSTWALIEELGRSKHEILLEYLDTIYWGRSYYGIDAAAEGYFKTTREQLSVAQSFFLTERIASPNLVLVGRVGILLRTNLISVLFSENIEAKEELIKLYEEHFNCGNKLRDM